MRLRQGPSGIGGAVGLILSLRSLRKSYDDSVALDDLSLEVREGEIFGLLGPNGAGKTTTLRIVAGLVYPDSGSVEIDSIDALQNQDDARRVTAYVPDEPTVYPKLTGREFLRFTGRLRRIDPEELERRIEFHERLFDMKGWLDTRAESYSHGMVQRVVLSSAFIAVPRLYAIDEPLVGLDPATAETFYRMARSAVDNGAAMVLSTHTLPVAHRFCDRLGIIHEGRLRRVMLTSDVPREDLQDIFFDITGTEPAVVKNYFRDVFQKTQKTP
ncbi:ATP-binding cassette domain-containing protein [Candidatus Fermentibacteria bacterium]|nr:ATP-binding cassette domain-containing protein [Candidatus Fermentibacteria bacterium]